MRKGDMDKLEIEKKATIGKLTVTVRDGRVHVKGDATLTPEDWERISEHLDLSTGEKKHCGCHPWWYSPTYTTTSITSITPDIGGVTWMSDTGSEVLLTT
jgi:hypothetical protein